MRQGKHATLPPNDYRKLRQTRCHARAYFPFFLWLGVIVTIYIVLYYYWVRGTFFFTQVYCKEAG